MTSFTDFAAGDPRRVVLDVVGLDDSRDALPHQEHRVEGRRHEAYETLDPPPGAELVWREWSHQPPRWWK